MSGTPPASWRRAWIGLGANLGDTAAALDAACVAIDALPRTRLLRRSSLYRSGPVEAEGPDYLNAGAEVETDLTAHDLLAQLHAIEQRHGRERTTRNAPRTLDLDLLLFGDDVVATPALTVPHPRLHERAFALVPLHELAPDLVVPGRGGIAQLLPGVAGQAIERVAQGVAAGLSSPVPLPRSLRHIAVEGPIGVGKTTLAVRLARRLDAETLLEQPADNPFLERFYRDREGYAFQTQLFFLFQRLAQLRELAQPGMFVQAVVSDFMFDKDALFARLNLSDEEYHHYAQMYGRLAPQLPQPDVVIWLQASPQTLLGRIRRRGIAMEQRIDDAYLQALCDAYTEYFRTYQRAPVLGVDSERSNPAGVEADFEQLLARLQGLREGRADPAAAAAPGH